MRTLAFVFIILYGATLFGYACPLEPKKEKQADKAFDFLGKFKGQFVLGACQVEITVCDPQVARVEGNPVAEVFLVDQKNRAMYLSIEYPAHESSLLRTQTKVSHRMFNYRKRDRHYEEELGRTEHYRLEILTEWADQDSIGSIHLGSYSTNNQLNQANGNDSRWVICE